MTSRTTLLRALPLLATFAAGVTPARAAEHVTLRNGSEFDCSRQELSGDRVRLYLSPQASATAASPAPASPEENYIEVASTSILRIETTPDLAPAALTAAPLLSSRNAAEKSATPAPLTPAAMAQMLTRAGATHNIDADLLASIVHAESNGNPRAVSRAGARGLMQLMPATASTLGVQNAFAPEENISGGTAYLDQLLTRYHDDLRLAVAAYNAGPAAVDRYRGIPPYAETRAYVTRVVREFNRRKRAAISALSISHSAAHAPLIAAR
jgi:soluble lytic murein transglycosylase-like protein